ncbi:MAG: glycosyl hydrolase family 18 protein, partial [Gammaproteobacteria bacterium]
MNKKIVCGCFISALRLSSTGYTGAINQTITAAPTTCISTQFSATGSQYWKTVTLQIKNQCTQPVNLQNATLTFKNAANINTNFWGNFSPLSYPDNNLMISSQKQSDGSYLASLNLHFPEQYSTTILPVGSSFQIIYGINNDTHVEGSASFYLQGGAAGDTGTLRITNQSASPANINQPYAVVHIASNGQNIKDMQVPWSNFSQLSGLSTGAYILSPENILDTAGNVFQGNITPSTVTISKNATTEAKLNFSQIQKFGQITINMPAVPDKLNGYTSNPIITLTQQPSGGTSTQTVPWNNATTVSNLTNNANYALSTPAIDFNGSHCVANFNPKTLAAQTTASTTTVSYQCTQVQQDSVNISVQGLPSSQSILTVVLKPIDNTTSITQTITLSNGAGTGTFTVTDGSIYTIQAQDISGYQATISPQPFTATAGGTATISYAKSNSTGRVIGFLPGWKTPPPVQDLANAGYTHIMVAFGVFSTNTPGTIVSAFDTVTADYIAALHKANIKVLLSLGGASTSLPNTTVNFDQVVKAAASPTAFKTSFINSLQSLITQYGFDGFDIDIEQGLIPSGTFVAPTGDLAVLADIINTMYQQNKNLLITLTPQVANISATSGFDQTWGNYASLIMRTYSSLAWVGIQLYNTGCAYGLDQICYNQTETANPDFSVAMAADLLENWPATLANGRASGFQPYVSHLNPGQVVLGYPAPDASGNSDG